VNFAGARGKPLAFPEWGPQLWLTGTSYIGGGDDSYFISAMTGYMAGASMQALWEDIGVGLFDTDAYSARAAGLQAPDVARTTFLFNFGNTNTGSGGAPYSGSGSTGGTTTQPVVTAANPPGHPPGPTGLGAVGSPAPGAGWEVFVRSYADYTTLLCQIPSGVFVSFQCVKQLNDTGSGSVVLDMDAAWWKTAVMAGGATANEILDFECLWQVTQDGVARYEFLGETITEQLVDASEQRLVTVTGPGTAAVLKQAMAAPQGFPDIINKLDGLADGFGEIGATGQGVLDTNIWTVASPAQSVYITPVPQQFSAGSTGPVLSASSPSGTLTIAATAGITLLGSTPWDATDTLISAQLSPVGAAGTATDSSGNPLPYGSNLDGSELTQMYVESLKNTAYAAGFGLSAREFYAWITGPSGTLTQVISSAGGYDLSNYAYWMITEQGGSAGGAGTFYWWTSPDGSKWTQQWTSAHAWDATEVGLFFTAKYDTAGQSAILSSLNSNVATPSYQGNIYLDSPAMGIWTDLLGTAQARGTIPFVGTAATGTADSFGNAWTDSQNVQVTNGTNLFQLLQGFCQVLDADFVMQPGFTLAVGQDIALGGTAVSLGTDRSAQVIFREGKDELAKQRVRARDKIANLLGVENSDGREISASSASSAAEWGQREGWFQTAALVDPVSMEIAAAAFTAATDTEVLSWTLAILPNVAGRTVFQSFDVGDWVGLERPDFTAVDAVRVIAIAVQVDQDGVETHELTLQSYLAYLQEQFTYISAKLGGGFVNLPGTTPVAPGRYGTGQVPTWFAPAATLANLADVVGTGGAGGAPLVYNAATGQWQPATAADPVSGTAVGLSLPSPGGTVSVNNGQVTVSSAVPAPAIDGGGTLAASSTTTTPTTTTVTDSAGNMRITIGTQSDGTVTTITANGPPPLAPDVPVVTAGVLGLTVAWDGLLGGAAPLLDFMWTEVHVSTTTGFTPSAATLQGTMHAGGVFGVGALVVGTTYYVKLVARNNSKIAGPASTQSSGVPAAPAGAKVTFAANASPPSMPVVGDLWYVTDQGNQLKTWTGAAWILYQYGAGAIANGAITTTQIASSANILGSQLSASAGITGTQLANSTITVTQLNSSVTARALGGIMTTIAASAPGSPNAGDLWFNSANNYELNQYASGAWTPYQFGTNAIAAGSVTAALIAANTITAGQIAAGAIGTTQLAATSVTAAKIAANTITASQIATGTITAGLLAAGIVVSGIVDATTIQAATVAAGNLLIYSGTPAAGTLVGSFTSAAGTDAYGNSYPVGVAASQATFTGVSIGSSGIDGSSITGGTVTNASVGSPNITGGLMAETSIVFDQVGGELLVYATSTTTSTITSGTTWTTPSGSYTQGKVECWGADAGGGGGYSAGGGEGGGGAGYGCEPNYPLAPSTTVNIAIGQAGTGGTTGYAGQNGTQTAFDKSGVFGNGVLGNGGQAGSGGVGGLGGVVSGNTVSYPGGRGGSVTSGTASAGGGGRAGAAGPGGNAPNVSGSAGAGGAAGSGTGGLAGAAGVAAGTSGNSGNGTSTGAGSGAGASSGYTQGQVQYNMSASATYYGNDATGGNATQQRNTGTMFQGGQSSGGGAYNGTMFSLAIINGTPATDLSGKTIDQVTVRFNNQWSWYSTGMYLLLGYGNSTSLPSTWNGTITASVGQFWIGQGATTTFDLTGLGLGSAMQSGAARCLTLGSSTQPQMWAWNYGYEYGAGGSSSYYPLLTVNYHSGTAPKVAGSGSGGVIKVTYNSSTALVAAIAPAAGTDGSSNAYAVGYTGSTRAFQPASSPTAVETWHSVSYGGGFSGYMRYKKLAEFNFAVIDFDLQYSAGIASPVTLFAAGTMPASYNPTAQHNRPVLSWVAAAPTSQKNEITINTDGSVILSGWTGSATAWGGTVIYPLD
jgi:hypothetical protein